jgi:hypothetical protein
MGLKKTITVVQSVTIMIVRERVGILLMQNLENERVNCPI